MMSEVFPKDITKDDALWRAGCKAFRAALNEMTGCDGYVVQKTYEAIRAHIVAQAAIAASQQAAPVSAAHKDSVLLQELLARIHRDGGHHSAAVGTEQSAKDADGIIAVIYAAAGPDAKLVEALHKKAIEAVQEWVQAEYRSTKSLGRGGPSHEEELDKAERKARDAIAALVSLPPTQEA